MRLRNSLDELVFPAHAGMSLKPIERLSTAQCFPRSRGDEPDMIATALVQLVFSPLTRG